MNHDQILRRKKNSKKNKIKKWKGCFVIINGLKVAIATNGQLLRIRKAGFSPLEMKIELENCITGEFKTHVFKKDGEY